MTISRKTNKKTSAVGGAGFSQSSIDAGQCAYADTTSQTQKEAAIIAFRVEIDALYAEADLALLGSFEEVRALLRGFFERGRYVDWPDFPETLPPLEKAERRWFFNEFYGLFLAARDSGVGTEAVQTITYAPLLAADRDARRDEADEAYLAQIRADRRDAREVQARWMEGDSL
jgi:hypothetical protein